MMIETDRLWLYCVALAVLCFSLQAAAFWLIYQSDLLWTQPWRLWTAHLVHVSWMHALLNVTALLLLPWIFPQYPVRRFWLMLLLGCPLLSLGLSMAVPEVLRYAGLSGILHGLYVSAAIHALVCRLDRQVAWILLLGLTVKLMLEGLGFSQANAVLIGAPVLSQAHILGVIVVLMLGAILGHFSNNQRHNRPV